MSRHLAPYLAACKRPSMSNAIHFFTYLDAKLKWLFISFAEPHNLYFSSLNIVVHQDRDEPSLGLILMFD